LVGLLDDFVDLSKYLRFGAQFAVAAIILAGADSILPQWLLLLAFVFIVGMINLVNFMYGIDGLVGSCFLIIFATYGYRITPTLFVLAGCLLAFLIFNWSPAKIFMGDAGTMFVGLSVVWLLIIGTQGDANQLQGATGTVC